MKLTHQIEKIGSVVPIQTNKNLTYISPDIDNDKAGNDCSVYFNIKGLTRQNR